MPKCQKGGNSTIDLVSIKSFTNAAVEYFWRNHTAISIYVVGSKLQAYATRPKGGMGRLELILGFRGGRREIFAVGTRGIVNFVLWA